jgi:hypothetical protein
MHKTHGMSSTSFYKSWRAMKDRFNPKDKDYPNYGGRGITLDTNWDYSFENFYDDMFETYEEGLTLDRIDNEKGYNRDNCKWSTPKQQCNNRRSNVICEYKGEKLNLSQFAEKYNIKRHTMYDRYNKMKWSIEKCIETPQQVHNKKLGGNVNEINRNCS